MLTIPDPEHCPSCGSILSKPSAAVLRHWASDLTATYNSVARDFSSYPQRVRNHIFKGAKRLGVEVTMVNEKGETWSRSPKDIKRDVRIALGIDSRGVEQ